MTWGARLCLAGRLVRAKQSRPIRQSRPDSGVGFQVNILETLRLSPLRSEVVTGVTSPLVFPDSIQAHIRQSRPDSGVGFQVKILETASCVCIYVYI